jgi:diguanylate cyclase (GGDEF)-like protein
MALLSWRTFFGPAVTLVTVIGIYVSDRHLFTVPNPGAISFVAVVFAAYIGGVTSGLVSAAISICYAAVHFSLPGQFLQFHPDNLARLYVLAVATPVIATMVGALQARAKHALESEQTARRVVEAAHSELLALRSSLDHVHYGIVLLDHEMRAQFINRSFRRMWRLPDELADRKPAFVGLLYHGCDTKAYAIDPDDMAAFVSERMAQIRAGNARPFDIRLANGEVICLRCKVLPEGGRMLTFANVTERVEYADQLQELATHDALTGIYNRRHFLTLAEREWSRFQRYGRPLSLLVVDVDYFKSVNDRYGHHVGDRVIVHVADVCRSSKRTSDVVARIGGEEFAILLPETGLAEACALADRIRDVISARAIVVNETAVSFTVSIGVSEAGLDITGTSDLLRQADSALYAAKRAGRNRVLSFDTAHLMTAAAAHKPATAA